jgi:hypothetical protein
MGFTQWKQHKRWPDLAVLIDGRFSQNTDPLFIDKYSPADFLTKAKMRPQGNTMN